MTLHSSGSENEESERFQLSYKMLNLLLGLFECRERFSFFFSFFLESYHHVWKTPNLDRCTLSPQSKLDGHGLIHLKAQPELCAAEET